MCLLNKERPRRVQVHASFSHEAIFTFVGYLAQTIAPSDTEAGVTQGRSPAFTLITHSSPRFTHSSLLYAPRPAKVAKYMGDVLGSPSHGPKQETRSNRTFHTKLSLLFFLFTRSYVVS